MKTEVKKFEQAIKNMKPDNSNPYQMGYDAGKNGSNETNCHFTLFSTPEKTKEWERGKADADKEKLIAE